MRSSVKRFWAPAVVAIFFASVAPGSGATFYQQPPVSNPSGTATYQFQVHSDGGAGGNGAAAYKVPGGDWQRCKPSGTQFTMSDLADGTYTVLIADDINLTYWAAQGQLYSGHTAGCDTTDPPVTAITSYTFTVGAPPTAPAPAPAAPTPTAPVTTGPATPTNPKTLSAPQVSSACANARILVTSGRRQVVRAQAA